MSCSISIHMAYCAVSVLNLYLSKTSCLGEPGALMVCVHLSAKTRQIKMSAPTLEFAFVGNAKGGGRRTLPAHRSCSSQFSAV